MTTEVVPERVCVATTGMNPASVECTDENTFETTVDGETSTAGCLTATLDDITTCACVPTVWFGCTGKVYSEASYAGARHVLQPRRRAAKPLQTTMLVFVAEVDVAVKSTLSTNTFTSGPAAVSSFGATLQDAVVADVRVGEPGFSRAVAGSSARRRRRSELHRQRARSPRAGVASARRGERTPVGDPGDAGLVVARPRAGAVRALVRRHRRRRQHPRQRGDVGGGRPVA